MASGEGRRHHHNLVPLAALISRELKSEKMEKPTVRYGHAAQSRKGEDYFLIKTDGQRVPGNSSSTFSAFAIFDGHNGNAAAVYTRENLLKHVLGAIPRGLGREEWLQALPRALVAGFVKTDKDFQSRGETSGTTATFVIVDGWTVTVASVGDSRCILDTQGGAVSTLTVDHRLEENVEERERVAASGGEVGRLSIIGGAEIGPLRCWPGGLCLSRSIGDMDVGEFIVPIPYVKQVKLSNAGGRLIIASDGIWDALSSEMAAQSCRGLPAELAARQVVKEALRSRGLKDDTTCIVVDIIPPDHSVQPSTPPKKQNKLRTLFFRKKSRDSANKLSKKLSAVGIVEELFEEGSAMLAERLGSDECTAQSTTSGLFMCAVCQVDLAPSEGISVHAGSIFSTSSKPWQGPFLCSDCCNKKDAMEGKRPSGVKLLLLLTQMGGGGGALFIFSLLTHLVVLHSTEEEKIHKRCPPYYCNDQLSKLQFPFKSMTQHPECGLFTVDCSDQHNPRIQLREKGHWHELENISATNTIFIDDKKLQQRLKTDSCNDQFFNDLSLPSLTPVFELLAHNLTLYQCTNATAYYTYYTTWPDHSLPSLPSSCSIILMPFDLFALTTIFSLQLACLPDDKGKFKCSVGEKGDKLGLKLGLVALAAIVVLGAIVCCFFWKKQNQSRQIDEAFLVNYGPLQVRRYSYLDVKKMTNSFKEKLGQGGYGSVYKGKLNNSCLVAVKVLNKLKGNGEEFMNEVAAISRTSHVNIVSLLGFCFEGSKRALIYEFTPNGSLEKFTFDANTPKIDHGHHLGWEALDRIALGIARGLEYLHRGCKTRILHFDIKPHNILLDQKFFPKISYFGLAKICNRDESIVSIM
ncbi:unnamed protein product [Prunus brigantina]